MINTPQCCPDAATARPKPLAIDLFCGLGGWTEGLLAEGWDVIGFDIERHVYGDHRYPAQLVVQDVLTLHGSQFRTADLIVASPPCQAYSWRAMPRKAAKAAPPPSNELFDACFRIQREACEAAGRHIPMIVENVRGAQKWVGRARWNYGSFYLWGDVPALMPRPCSDGVKVGGLDWKHPDDPRHRTGQAFNPAAQGAAIQEGRKAVGSGRAWFDESLNSRRRAATGIKNGGGWFGSGNNSSLMRRASSKSTSRKFASALIAKIPLPLSRHIGRCFYPKGTP
jgi:hypothetical protein